jgi:hypothetical protein
MEYAAAPAESGAEAAVVQDVGAAQGEPLLRSIQGKQVGVLLVRFTNLHHFRSISQLTSK